MSSLITKPVTRAALGETCKQIMTELEPALANIHGQRVGAVTILFGLQQPDLEMAFISNVERAAMLHTLRVLVRSLERGTNLNGIA